MRKLGLILAVTGFAFATASGVYAACTGACSGYRFYNPPSNANDLHVEFNSALSSVSHIPSPPAPAGDVSWPNASIDPGRTSVNFSGTSMPSGGTTSYKFEFAAGANTSIKLAKWTHDAAMIGDADFVNVPYEP